MHLTFILKVKAHKSDKCSLNHERICPHSLAYNILFKQINKHIFLSSSLSFQYLGYRDLLGVGFLVWESPRYSLHEIHNLNGT